jgi:pimeloyl-ACP methyl ester carboxylesterase
MVSTMELVDEHRGQLEIKSGPVSYIDTGGPGRPVLFVHGLATSSYLWRNVIEQLRGERRCVAFDLPLHGGTPAAADQDFSLPGLAGFLTQCADALGLSDIDLVGNDTGGAISQAVTAADPARLHTLTLTNCEARGNLPPRALLPAKWLAKAGLSAYPMRWLMADEHRARRIMYGTGYEDLANLPEEVSRAWLAPMFGTRAAARQNQRILPSLRARDLLAIEPALRRLQVPTLIVWGTGDRFFSTKWAYWLRDTIPGATEVVELDGARLFFPDERAGELAAALRRHWAAHP